MPDLYQAAWQGYAGQGAVVQPMQHGHGNNAMPPGTPVVTLDAATIERIARRVVALLREPADAP